VASSGTDSRTTATAMYVRRLAREAASSNAISQQQEALSVRGRCRAIAARVRELSGKDDP